MTRTRGGRRESTDESTELWRHPEQPRLVTSVPNLFSLAFGLHKAKVKRHNVEYRIIIFRDVPSIQFFIINLAG